MDALASACHTASLGIDHLDVGFSALAVVHPAHTALSAHAWHRGRDDDPGIAAAQQRIADINAEMQRYARDHRPPLRLAPIWPSSALNKKGT
jgi:hypothetical protein